MPAFEYEALDGTGRSRRGVVAADTPRQARMELRSRHLTPVAIKAPKEKQAKALFGGGAKKVSTNQLVIFTRQLAVLIGAATPLEEALNAVALQTEQEHARQIILSVRERVIEGWRFADAMKEHPKSFPDLYRAVIAAGETSGDLGGVLDRLASMLEKNRSMRNAALAALIYPAALAVVAGGVITALLTMVVPKIIENFNTFNAELPLITQIVVTVSDFLGDYGLVLLGLIVVAAIGFWQAMKIPAFKQGFDRGILRVPLLGKLLRGLDGARFARTLSTLFSGGAPLLDSLVGAQRTVSNDHIRARLDQTVTMVREGSALASALKRPNVLPPMMVHMVAAGERAGEVPQLLDKAAEQLEEEFETASTVALRLLEPGIIIAMGGVVMVIVLSIMLPILRLNTLASG
ncbi:MAG: type II secretion system inner membrane protein GspF [Pseudomonadota bacterium]